MSSGLTSLNSKHDNLHQSDTELKSKMVIQQHFFLVQNARFFELQDQIQTHMDTKTGHISDLQQKYSELAEAMDDLKPEVSK